MIKRIFIIITALSVIAFGLYQLKNNHKGMVQAVGDLDVIWGVPDGSPIFVVDNMLPGDSESRTVTVVNNASVMRPLAVRADNRYETASFSSVLDFSIAQESADIYGGTSITGPKSLADFFTETATPSSLFLKNLNPGESVDYTFYIHFQESAGNEFQRAKVIFDIIFGLDIDIPQECRFIEFTGPPIYGTAGNDRIFGTLKNDLIYALEGDDKVYASLGDDCIIGGTGKDELRGEFGNDVIFGNEDKDLVIGGDGKDIMFGNGGDDVMRGENGQDLIYGGTGDDYITGGNNEDLIYGEDGNDQIFAEAHNDIVYGGPGDDILDGGAGNDFIYGGTGNDTLHGKSDNDTLIGEIGIDFANGWSGTDTCDAETETACEF